MNSKVIVWGTALALGAGMFVLLSFGETTAVASVGGAGTFLLSLIAMHKLMGQGAAAVAQLQKCLEDEGIAYIGVSGLMREGQELVGALAITAQRVVFERVNRGATTVKVERTFADIAQVENHGGFFVLTDAQGTVYRFKVFDCNKLVAMMREYQAA